MVDVDIPVTKPFALTVAVRVWLAAPKLPTLLLTVESVKAPELLIEASPLTVTKVGAELVTPTRICPLVPTVVVLMLEPPFPSSKELAVKLDCPVPPLATESCPVKPGVKVCTEPTELIVKVILASVPVAKVWLAVVNPFNEVIAPEAEAQLAQAKPDTAVEEAVRHNPSPPTV
jgi:hypothetical protein